MARWSYNKGMKTQALSDSEMEMLWKSIQSTLSNK